MQGIVGRAFYRVSLPQSVTIVSVATGGETETKWYVQTQLVHMPVYIIWLCSIIAYIAFSFTEPIKVTTITNSRVLFPLPRSSTVMLPGRANLH